MILFELLSVEAQLSVYICFRDAFTIIGVVGFVAVLGTVLD